MCFKGIAKKFQISKYMKPPNEGIAGCALRVFFSKRGVMQSQHI
jgi:hypothetical protein